MGDIFTFDKIIYFTVLFVPGFITLKVHDLIISGPRRDFSKGMFDAVSYGILNFSVFSWLIIFLKRNDFHETNSLIYWGCYFLIIVIAPMCWPILYLKVLTKTSLRHRVVHPVNSAWDWCFSRREAAWVIVHLKDGRRIGGVFDVNSFVSSGVGSEQIYIEEVWNLSSEGAFLSPVQGSLGVILLQGEILGVEFLSGEVETDE